MNQAHREVERMTDLAATYERSIANKDQIIANLTGALQRQVCGGSLPYIAGEANETPCDPNGKSYFLHTS